MESLAIIVSRTTRKVFLEYPRLNYDEFSSIVKEAKNCQILVFDRMTFEKSGTICFGKDVGYKIYIFSLQSTGKRIIAVGKRIGLS